MKRYIVILSLVLCQINTKAQLLDSLKMEVGTNLTAASKDFLPLWLVANRFGVISDRKFDASTNFKATTSVRYGEEFLDIYSKKDRGYYIDLGVDIYNNSHFGKVLIQEAYVKVRHRKLQLSAGRFKQIIGEVDPDLSSGSLGVSGNALPIPKISLSLDYNDVPFTNGFAQFKGQISHGWMGNHQYMQRAFLHEKNVYIRLGKGDFKIYGGVQHYAVWGGNRGDFKTERSLKGFFDVILVKEANDGTVPDGILPNRAGDHRGVLEGGIDWENDDIKVNLNNQTPFDMGQGIDIRNIDRLLSLNIINKNSDSFLKKLTFEFLYTKQMNDFYKAVFRESYYNNGVYKTGWEYQDNIIGTPLFTNRFRGVKFLNDLQVYDWQNIEDSQDLGFNIIVNRVIGGHFGMAYNLSHNVSAKTLATITKNYGVYVANAYNDSKSQFYSLQQFAWSMPNSKISLIGSLAFDRGEIYNNFGSMIGLNWRL